LIVLLASPHKPAQHTHRLFITRIHQIGNRTLDVVTFLVLMELAIAATLHTRIADAVTVRTLGFHCQHWSIERLSHINLVNDLDLLKKTQRILFVVGVADEPGPEPGIARLLCSPWEYVTLSKAGRATVVLDPCAITARPYRPEMTARAALTPHEAIHFG
jgi:hypothetical protein